jgi:nucleoid DNA-binding protein
MAKKNTSPVSEPMNRSALYSQIAESTGLSSKQVKAVFEELASAISRHVSKRGVGVFTLPGLLKIKTVKKPARKAQKGVPNPFRPGELMDVAAKPATVKVKALPLKKLKDMALT